VYFALMLIMMGFLFLTIVMGIIVMGIFLAIFMMMGIIVMFGF
jgi:hypothetical protein